MSEDYGGRQVVGLDLHRNRTVMSGHRQVGAEEVDVELHPDRGTDQRRDRQPQRGSVDRGSGADLESEPIVEVERRGASQVAFGDRARDVAVDVDGQAAADSEVAGQQRGRAFDDSSVVDEVEPFEKAVVGDLALQLLIGLAPSRARALRRSVSARRNAAGLA